MSITRSSPPDRRATLISLTLASDGVGLNASVGVFLWLIGFRIRCSDLNCGVTIALAAAAFDCGAFALLDGEQTWARVILSVHPRNEKINR
eukprot:COSAG02_NODE_14001_length_1322_cov_1.668847_3_plen_91_part_00